MFVALALCVSAPVYASDDNDWNAYELVDAGTSNARYTTRFFEHIVAGGEVTQEMLDDGADPRLGLYSLAAPGTLRGGFPFPKFVTPLMHMGWIREEYNEFGGRKRLIEEHCEKRGWDCRSPDLDSIAKAYFENKYCREGGNDCRQTIADMVKLNAMMAHGQRDCIARGGEWLPELAECREKQDAASEEESVVSPEQPVAPPKPEVSYDGAIYSAAVIIADGYFPSWVDTQTFAFNAGDSFVTGQSLSVPLDDFTFAATRVQVNNAADYEFGVKWEMEF